ncbi:DUF4394 domain-containing protein [Svornostia abyssi]|uniref:DUF4394 domain-containing protein n=1 Tax=Svornostia abyssi TaxID=2898438 RepID=A0ABY5PE00_9ACTN|nr:DUF4394 domain-containing protein [Parviterribacteraceae bacterium J379]
MSRIPRWTLTALTTAAIAAAAAPAAHATPGNGKPAAKPAPTEFVGVAKGTRLVRFDAAKPAIARQVPIKGLAEGESVVGLDTRPATGALYGVTDGGRIVTIDPRNGASAPVGAPFAPELDGEFFGFDFNPTVDRIRLTSDANQNLRLVPDTGQVAFTDGPLAYLAGDAAFGRDPSVVASAYTNPDTDPATGTTLYDIDAARDALVIQDPPNTGGLKTVGGLGVNVGYRGGFDIGADGAAYAALTPRGARASTLYRIDLATGAATAEGRVGFLRGVKLDALAILP